jgi:diguanylate cyclase (GGDEF)-like protein
VSHSRLDPRTIHELLTPLNTVVGLATLLRDGVDLERLPREECLQRIVDAGWRLEKQIRALGLPGRSVAAEPAPEPPSSPISTRPPSIPGRSGTQQKARVLVVDDVAENRVLLCEVLRSAGFDAREEPSGAACLETARVWQPSLIVLDIFMPELDGIEVCHRLKRDQLTADIPVLFVSASPDEATALAALSAGGRDFIERPVSPAIFLARVAVLVSSFESQKRLRELAMTDELTGLYSRRYFFESLRQHATRSARGGTREHALSCLMLDVDRFKTVNDRYGHLVGDDVLRWVAEQVRSLLRGGDVAARFGGEEFVVLLPETPEAGALRVAEKIRAAIEQGRERPEPRVTVSIGVATYEAPEIPGRTSSEAAVADALLRRVDAALYEAKRSGRNRVIAAA